MRDDGNPAGILRPKNYICIPNPVRMGVESIGDPCRLSISGDLRLRPLIEWEMTRCSHHELDGAVGSCLALATRRKVLDRLLNVPCCQRQVLSNVNQDAVASPLDSIVIDSPKTNKIIEFVGFSWLTIWHEHGMECVLGSVPSHPELEPSHGIHAH